MHHTLYPFIFTTKQVIVYHKTSYVVVHWLACIRIQCTMGRAIYSDSAIASCRPRGVGLACRSSSCSLRFLSLWGSPHSRLWSEDAEGRKYRFCQFKALKYTDKHVQTAALGVLLPNLCHLPNLCYILLHFKMLPDLYCMTTHCILTHINMKRLHLSVRFEIIIWLLIYIF